jgi:hypothetical protein
MSEEKKNGKGDSPRSCFSKEYRDNFDVIDWSKMDLNKINKIFEENKLYRGRMVSASKSYYCSKHPDNMTVFNGNIISEKFGKVWYGDLDVTLDADILRKISEEIGEDLYVLREFDARFGNESDDLKKLIKKAVWSTKNE